MKSESKSEGQREDSAVVARVCWAYFKEGQTQEAIAQRLGLTRKRVIRILNDARTSGFVQITINDPMGACAELEARLQATFGLRRAIVVPAPADGIDVRTVVGAAAGYYVSAPMFADTADLRKLLMASDPVREVLQKTRRLDMALLSAVDLSRESHALEYGVISRDTWRSLRTAGAVGDICGHYLDVEGAVVDHPIARRTINPPLPDLQAVKELVLAAGGAHKAPIIRGAIRAKLCHILITDEAAAAALLAFK